MLPLRLRDRHEGLLRHYFHGDLSMEKEHAARFFYDRRLDAFVPNELAKGGSPIDVHWFRRELEGHGEVPRGYFRPKKALNVFTRHPLMKADLRLVRKLENYHRAHLGEDARFDALEAWEKINGPVP